MDFKVLYDKAVEKTVLDGLKYDINILRNVKKDNQLDLLQTLELEEDYRWLGMIFSINLYDNIQRMLDKKTNKKKHRKEN